MKRYLLIAYLFLTATLAIAQPANDACSGAISTNPNGTCYTGTTVGAADNWLGTVGCAGNNAEVWYSFVATGSQLSYNVTSGTLGGNIELIVVSSTSACSGLSLVGSACGASPLTGNIQGLQSGTTYYYTISGTGATGTFTTCMTTSNPAPVAGQDCPTASILCSSASFTQSTSNAGFGTQEISTANSCWGSGGERQSKWYKFTIGCSGTLGFIINPIVSTNDYDWALYNITANPSACGLTSSSSPAACNWSGCAGPTGLDASPTTIAGVQSCGGPAGACGGGSYPRAFCNETAANMNLLNVTAGQTFALLVDNFSTSNSGFNFSFSGTATIGPDAAFTLTSSNCGQNVTVTKTCPTSNSTYLWNFGDGFTSTSAGPVSHTYATTGSYVISLTVTDALGCSKTSSQTISGTPPATPAPSSNSPVCAGSTLNLSTATVSGATYSWTGPNGFTSTSQNPSISNVTTAASGTYSVVVTVGGCPSTAGTVVVTVNPVPTAPTAGSNSPICAGSTLNLTATTVAGATYSWTGPNGFTSTSQNPSITNATTAASGTYSVTATVNGCTSVAGTVSVTVNPIPTAPTASSNSPVCAGSTLNLGATTVAGATYSWTGPNGFTATGQNPAITNATTAANGTYSVTVTVNGCTSAAGTVSVTVNPVPTAPSAGSNSPICAGSTLNLTAATVTGATYSWTGPNAFTSTSQNPGITNATTAASGTYSVTVTVNGCTSVAGTVSVTVNPVPAAPTAGSNSPICAGSTLNLTSTTVTGATYSWTGPNAFTSASQNPSITNATTAASGTYSVTVTVNGCTSAAGTVSVTVNPIPTAPTASSNSPICAGSTLNLTATTVTGGTYSWTGPTAFTSASQNPSITNATTAASGTYSVTVTVNGCSSVAGTATVTVNPVDNASFSYSPSTFCQTGTNPTPVITGTAGGTFTSSPAGLVFVSSSTGQINLSASALNTYTITYTTAGVCPASSSMTITITSAPSASFSYSSPFCQSAANPSPVFGPGASAGTFTSSAGLVFVNASTGQINLAASTPGTYTVTNTIPASGGCQVATSTATVTINANPAASITSSNVSCNGGNNGSATVTASGGSGTYTYLWSPGNSTASTVSNLSPGSYTVTVTDGNNCPQTASVTISQPAVLSAATSSTNATCNAATGSATVNATGGTPGYTYLWSPSGQTTATATNLSAGTYSVTVTDANSCTQTSTVTVGSTSVPVATLSSSTNVSCNGGSNGSATVNVTGGTGTYSYLWSPGGATTSTATGLPAGTYTVTATDGNNCTSTASVTITQPTALASSVTSQTNVSCNGGSNGTATVNITGGTPNYTYSWAPSGGTTATGTGLSQGTYTLTATDANGCVLTQTVNITQPAVLSANIATSANVLCNGGNTGSATVSVTGGTSGYSYSWSPSGGTAAAATGLTAGSYTVTVTDANSCTQTASVTITEPTAIVLSQSSTNATCGNADGTATVNATGGNPSYTYLWSPSGQTTATATGLLAGIYSVTVTDNNSCSQTTSITVNNASAPVATLASLTNVSCNGGNNGSAGVNVTGGTGTYSYAWSLGGATTPSVTGLTAGSYTVTVSDGNNCITSVSVTVTEPAALTTTLAAQTNVSCNGGSDGSASVSVNGGTPGYSYSWSPLGGTTGNATGLAMGTYTLNITDGNGCMATQTVSITEPPALTLTTSTTNAACSSSNGSATVTPAGGSGTYTYQWNDAASQTTATATGLAPGNYTVTVTDGNGCIQTSAVTVIATGSVNATLSANVNVSCNGGSDGSATVTASGGIAPYTYSWSPAGGTNAMATGLGAGNYTVTITDNAGCTNTATVSITQPAALTLATSGVNISCSGGNNGSATVIPAGGTGPYSYSWSTSPVQTASTASGLTAGVYTVTVTDNNGCVTTSSVTLTQPAALTASSAIIDATCAGPGSATVTPAGGAGPYTYLWNDPSAQTSATAANLQGGNYTVTVTDANGCTVTSTASISNVTPIVASFTQSPVTGPAPLTVTFTNSSAGAVTYLWIFGDNSTSAQASPTHTYSNGGTYTVTLIVTNADGCTDTVTFASIDVIAESALTLPNVFSPNGDGINDQFLPDAKNITEFHGEIYDRWGVLMQKWDEAFTGWDGHTTSGTMASDGVYYYIVTAKGADGKEYVLHGFLTLLK